MKPASTSKRVYTNGKQGWMWFQNELQPCTELRNSRTLPISTTFLIGKHPRYTAREICTHQQYQMRIPREAITLWCGMFRCQRVMIHLERFVHCLLQVNTAVQHKYSWHFQGVVRLFTQMTSAFCLMQHEHTEEENQLRVKALQGSILSSFCLQFSLKIISFCYNNEIIHIFSLFSLWLWKCQWLNFRGCQGR